MSFPSFTGEQQISPEISIIGGDFFPREEEGAPVNISQMNKELEGMTESIIFEVSNEKQDTMLEHFLRQEEEKI